MATIPAHVTQPERRRIYLAAAVALIAELGVFAGAFVMLTHKQAPPPEPPLTMLSLAPAPAAQPAAQQPVALPRPQPPVRPVTPVHHVEHVAPPRPAPHAPAPHPPTPAPAPVMPSAAPTEAPPAPRPPPPAPAPAPAAAPAAPAAPSASFGSALRAAIQAALQYPESARMAGIAGRTRVAFQYRDGVVSDVKVVVSSGVGLLDRAALAAVRDAACPKPDPAYAGKTLSEQLWVTFNLNEHE